MIQPKEMALGEVRLEVFRSVQMWGSDGVIVPHLVDRWHFYGRCVHKKSCSELDRDRGLAPNFILLLEAYAEWPRRDSFTCDYDYEKACEGYKSLEEHAANFFKEFRQHNQEKEKANG